MLNTCSDVGGRSGISSPTAPYSSCSCRTESSELEVTEEESESAGVAVGAWARRRRASASDKADRYDAAVFGANADALFFLNIEDIGDLLLLKAIGEGRGDAGIVNARSGVGNSRAVSVSSAT